MVSLLCKLLSPFAPFRPVTIKIIFENLRKILLKTNPDNKNKKISIISQISTDKISILECGHAFHKECLEEWMVKSNNCPLCREDINTLKDDEASKLGQGVLNIQDTLNPFFLSNLYFNAASFKIEMLNRGGSGGHFIGGFSGGMGGLGGASGRW